MQRNYIGVIWKLARGFPWEHSAYSQGNVKVVINTQYENIGQVSLSGTATPGKPHPPVWHSAVTWTKPGENQVDWHDLPCTELWGHLLVLLIYFVFSLSLSLEPGTTGTLADLWTGMGEFVLCLLLLCTKLQNKSTGYADILLNHLWALSSLDGVDRAADKIDLFIQICNPLSCSSVISWQPRYGQVWAGETGEWRGNVKAGLCCAGLRILVWFLPSPTSHQQQQLQSRRRQLRPSHPTGLGRHASNLADHNSSLTNFHTSMCPMSCVGCSFNFIILIVVIGWFWRHFASPWIGFLDVDDKNRWFGLRWQKLFGEDDQCSGV